MQNSNINKLIQDFENDLNLEEKNNSDNESLGGLDEDDEEDFVYIQSHDGMIVEFNVKFVEKIKLINTILKSDLDAGRSKDDPIILNRIDDEILDMLKDYINHYKELDYIVDTNPEKPYYQKMNLWDRLFVKNAQKKDKLIKLLEIGQYLMFDTLVSKIQCFLANSESQLDYSNLWEELEKQNEEKIEKQSLN